MGGIGGLGEDGGMGGMGGWGRGGTLQDIPLSTARIHLAISSNESPGVRGKVLRNSVCRSK